MPPELTFWTAAVAPLVLPLFTPTLKWLTGLTVALLAGVFTFVGLTPDPGLWTAFVTLNALVALAAGVTLRLMLAFVRRMLDG